jgi:hypothetical protein
MVLTRAVQVRLSRDQHARVRQNSESRGFASVAAYLRYVALDQDFALYQKICEIHQSLLGTPTAKKYRKQRPRPPRRNTHEPNHNSV